MVSFPLPLRIGTRGSPLALVQTDDVCRRLIAACPDLGAEGAIEVVVIRTTGDRITDRPLADVGGKGLFSKEIDDALLGDRIDMAVHSVKDLPTWLEAGLVLAAILPREDPRDALICPGIAQLRDLPPGSVVGSSSLRRQAQILARRPDITVVSLRGNVDTRLQRVRAGEVTATLLALAGLKRLGYADRATGVLEMDEMLSAVGQGAIGVTCRDGDTERRNLLAALDHKETAVAVTCERAMLTVLDGSCRTPIAGWARPTEDGALMLSGLVARPDGGRIVQTERTGTMADAEALGADVGAELKGTAGCGFFDTSVFDA